MIYLCIYLIIGLLCGILGVISLKLEKEDVLVSTILIALVWVVLWPVCFSVAYADEIGSLFEWLWSLIPAKFLNKKLF